MEIRLVNVWHSYDGLSYVLRNINLELGSPGVYVLTGPNGAGKTTLLKIISLITKPTRGTVIVNGMDFWSLGERDRLILRAKVTYVHDKPILVRGSARANLELGLKLRGGLSANHALVEYFVERYMLKEFLDKPASKLSAGQAKIVSILRALLLKPKVLALDEPFTFLDDTRAKLLIEDLLSAVSNGGVVIVATHYVHRELRARVKQVIELLGGEIVRS